MVFMFLHEAKMTVKFQNLKQDFAEVSSMALDLKQALPNNRNTSSDFYLVHFSEFLTRSNIKIKCLYPLDKEH